MRKLGMSITAVAAALILASPAFSGGADQVGQGRVVVTILPDHSNDSAEQVANVPQGDLKVKVNGKVSSVTAWTPYTVRNSRIELVLLIDGSVRASLSQQFSEITSFVKEMPANSKVAIGYMQNGHAAMTGPFSSDASQVLQGLRMSAGSAGSNASPYFCLSDLAQHWPSEDRTARREVVMITDGVDNFNRAFDADDPYVLAAINDSVRAGLVIYSVYWQDKGRANSTEYETNAGQSLLQQVTDATGGNSYWQGSGNPVTFAPYFADLRRRLNHQYELTFTTQLSGKPEVRSMKLDLHVASAKVQAPQKVYVTPVSGSAGR